MVIVTVEEGDWESRSQQEDREEEYSTTFIILYHVLF